MDKTKYQVFRQSKQAPLGYLSMLSERAKRVTYWAPVGAKNIDQNMGP